MKPEFTLTKNLRFIPKDPEALKNYVDQLRTSLKTSQDLIEKVTLQGEIGSHLRSLDQFAEAETILQDNLNLIKKYNLGMQKEVQNKIRLAHVYQDSKQFKQSDALFCEILELCRIDNEAAPMLHFALQHAGKNEFDQGSLLPALRYFEEALSIRLRDSVPPDQIESTQNAISRVKELMTQNVSASDEFKNQIEKTIHYLGSVEAIKSIERDPYWPKWNSPWWHMCLLHELGLASEIPKLTIKKMVEVLKTHYLPNFPIRAEEIPPGTDPYRKIACHCAVGSMYQVLFSAGVDVDLELPWMRPWIIHYQLPDGGLNCDEQAYIKKITKSSIVSTINCLEAIFFCQKNALTPEEINFLDKGAQYLIKHKLFRKVSTGEVIDSNWLEIKFPRFYEYDFLRGYYFLAKWFNFRNKTLPSELSDEVRLLVGKQLSPEGIVLKRYNFVDKRSYNPLSDGSWQWGDASEFDLYKTVSKESLACTPLTKQWHEVKP